MSLTPPVLLAAIAAIAWVSVTRALARPEAREQDWPAESQAEAQNLTSLSSEFEDDLSGAVWNPVKRQLWLCRNGPGLESRLWVLDQSPDGSLHVSVRENVRGEWARIGDCEGVALASFEEPLVYLLAEGSESILTLDTSLYGVVAIRNQYDLSEFLPSEGKAGAEGIAFVPDVHLEAAGFRDARGKKRVSRLGMGGLMFVGHQNGGGLFAFDLNPSTEEVEHVGEYRVLAPSDEGGAPISRVVGLEFDRASGVLLAWHGLKKRNVLSLLRLSSSTVEEQSYRSLDSIALYSGPSQASFEGIAWAVSPSQLNQGSLYLTVDDGKADSLFRFDQFELASSGSEGPPQAENE